MSKRHSGTRSSRRSSSSSSSSSSSGRRDSSSRNKKSSSSRRRSSSSESDSRHRRSDRYSGKSSDRRRRDRSRSSEYSDEASSKQFSKSSQSKGSNKSTASSSSKLNKAYDFKQGIDELYKTEQNRSGVSSAGGVGMTKMDIEKDSFKPQEFRSSRTNRNQTTSSTNNNNNNNATSSRNDHEKAMFGSGPNAMFNPIQPVSTSSLPTVAEKTLMHSSFYEDVKIKENRWREKVVEHLKRIDQRVE